MRTWEVCAFTRHLVRSTRQEALQYTAESEGVDGASMTQEQVEKMKGCVTNPKVDAKTVKVTCYDGDVLEGFIEFVSDEERDVILELLSSSDPTKYKKGTCYVVRWDDIADFQELR